MGPFRLFQNSPHIVSSQIIPCYTYVHIYVMFNLEIIFSLFLPGLGILIPIMMSTCMHLFLSAVSSWFVMFIQLDMLVIWSFLLITYQLLLFFHLNLLYLQLFALLFNYVFFISAMTISGMRLHSFPTSVFTAVLISSSRLF